MKLMLERGSGSRKKKGGRAGKQQQLEGGKPMNILKRKTPIEIIEEREQKTSHEDGYSITDSGSERKKGGRVGKENN